MNAVVLSDTHIPRRAGELPRALIQALGEVDLIIHAGDFTSVEFYDELKTFGPLKAVRGNMDEPELREILPEKLILDLEGHRVGIMHGFGAPFKIGERVRARFGDEPLDLLIFGHSHRALLREIAGTKLLNPGSPTDRFFARKQSFASLDIGPSYIRANIIDL
jgi:hypothetical protein